MILIQILKRAKTRYTPKETHIQAIKSSSYQASHIPPRSSFHRPCNLQFLWPSGHHLLDWPWRQYNVEATMETKSMWSGLSRSRSCQNVHHGGGENVGSAVRFIAQSCRYLGMRPIDSRDSSTNSFEVANKAIDEEDLLGVDESGQSSRSKSKRYVTGTKGAEVQITLPATFRDLASQPFDFPPPPILRPMPQTAIDNPASLYTSFIVHLYSIALPPRGASKSSPQVSARSRSCNCLS